MKELQLPIQDERVTIDGVRICNRCSEELNEPDKYSFSLVFTTRSGAYAIIAHHDSCKQAKDYIPYAYDAKRSKII